KGSVSKPGGTLRLAAANAISSVGLTFACWLPKRSYRAYVACEQTARLSRWETERGAASPVCTDAHRLAIEVQLVSASHREGRTSRVFDPERLSPLCERLMRAQHI